MRFNLSDVTTLGKAWTFFLNHELNFCQRWLYSKLSEKALIHLFALVQHNFQKQKAISKYFTHKPQLRIFNGRQKQLTLLHKIYDLYNIITKDLLYSHNISHFMSTIIICYGKHVILKCYIMHNDNVRFDQNM